MLVSLYQDILFGLGQFYRKPKFMFSIVLCLALGMGPNTALFSLINELLLAKVNAQNPQQLVTIGYTQGDGERDIMVQPTSHADYLYLSERATSLQGSFATSLTQASVYHNGQAGLIAAQLVSSSFFAVLGRQAAIGKTFDVPADFVIGREPYVVLSHKYWQQQYNQADVIDQTLVLNGYDFKIIGVMPADFHGSALGMIPDIWVPLSMAMQMRPDSPHMINEPAHNWLQFHGRLADHASITSASEELAQLSTALVEQSTIATPRSYYATEYESYGIIPKAGLTLLSLALMFIGSLVLLLACASVGALLLARATERRQEMAVRLAMGASRFQLIRQLLIEGLLMSLASGILALLLTLWLRKGLFSFIPESPFAISFTLSMPIDFTVVAYVVCIAMLTTILFALAPALQASKFELMPALKDQPVAGSVARSTSLLRSIFLVVQFALSIALLISAATAIHSIQKAAAVDPGIESKNILVFKTLLSQYGFHGEPKEQLIQQLKQQFLQLDGVKAVGLARQAPFALDRSGVRVALFDQNADHNRQNSIDNGVRFNFTPVDQHYFSVLDIELLAGRVLNQDDRDLLSPAIVINQAAVSQLFGPKVTINSVIGRYLQLSMNQDAYEIVGVVETVKNNSLGEENAPFLYLPLSYDFEHSISFILRTTSEPQALIPALKDAISASDKLIAHDGISTIEELIAFIKLPLVIIASLSGSLGLLALILAIIGVYGGISYSISLRQQEVGVRLSLGASPNQLIWMLMKKGLLLSLLGAAIGLAIAWGITSVMSVVLIGNAHDPLSFIGVPVILLGVSMLAILIPASKTAYQQPMSVLRYE